MMFRGATGLLPVFRREAPYGTVDVPPSEVRKTRLSSWKQILSQENESQALHPSADDSHTASDAQRATHAVGHINAIKQCKKVSELLEAAGCLHTPGHIRARVRKSQTPELRGMTWRPWTEALSSRSLL